MYMSDAGDSVGPEPRAVVLLNFSHVGSLHVRISVKLVRIGYTFQ